MLGLLNIDAGGLVDKLSSFFEFAREAFLGFKIADAIDIFLLTLLFAFVLNFFKSRKAMALLIGIAICLAVWLLAVAFDLSGIRFILSGSGIFQIGALAFVVLFQPEIRDILERLGTGSLKGLRSIGSDSKDK